MGVGTVVTVKGIWGPAGVQWGMGLGEDKAGKHSKAFDSSFSLDSGRGTKSLQRSELESVSITLKSSLDHTRVCMNARVA